MAIRVTGCVAFSGPWSTQADLGVESQGLTPHLRKTCASAHSVAKRIDACLRSPPEFPFLVLRTVLARQHDEQVVDATTRLDPRLLLVVERDIAHRELKHIIWL